MIAPLSARGLGSVTRAACDRDFEHLKYPGTRSILPTIRIGGAKAAVLVRTLTDLNLDGVVLVPPMRKGKRPALAEAGVFFAWEKHVDARSIASTRISVARHAMTICVLDH